MEIRYPDYYKSFACLGGTCPDSCCHEWEVDVDPFAAEYYRQLPGELGDRLREVLKDGEDGWASMELTADRRCPMWRDDGLCRIQAELGHDALCGTCQKFPRLTHDYGDFTELGLELSCPEAARIILDNPCAQWITEEVTGGEDPAYDPDNMTVLLRSRDVAVRLALDDTIPVEQNLASVLLYAYAVQYATDWREVDCFSLEERLEGLPYQQWAGDPEGLLDICRELEILTERWRKMLDGGAVEAPWDHRFRGILRYFIDRYWLQAVDDGELGLRMKFAVVSCLVIHSLGGDLAETAQIYSKEIENSEENMDAMLESLETSSAAADLRLLNLLLK